MTKAAPAVSKSRDAAMMKLTCIPWIKVERSAIRAPKTAMATAPPTCRTCGVLGQRPGVRVRCGRVSVAHGAERKPSPRRYEGFKGSKQDLSDHVSAGPSA